MQAIATIVEVIKTDASFLSLERGGWNEGKGTREGENNNQKLVACTTVGVQLTGSSLLAVQVVRFFNGASW